MAEERDLKVSQRYRELDGEEPSRELDREIIAAAQRAADRPHAPLVAPAGRHRWYFAFGAAAILVLAVAVALQIDREVLDAEALATAPLPPAPAAGEPAPRPQVLPSEQLRDLVPAEPRIPEQRPQVVAPLRAPATIPAPSRREDAGVERQASTMPPVATADNAASNAKERSTAQAPMGRLADAQSESPERWIERIAQLRKDGKDDEADKQLAEFRRRYPDYRVPPSALRAAE